MRVLHLVARLDGRKPAAVATIAALARAHTTRVATGRITSSVELEVPVDLVEGLRTTSPEDVAAALDELVRADAPDIVVAHDLLNALALAWVASRGGIVFVSDLRAFHPERAVHGGTDAANDARTEADPRRPVLCDTCFEVDPFFRRVRETAEERRSALAGARAIVVEDASAKGELEALAVGAPIVILPPEPHARAAWLSALT